MKAKLGRPFDPLTDNQKRILDVVKENPNKFVSDWAEKLDYTPGTLNVLLKKLQNKGYLTYKKPVKARYKITEKALEDMGSF